MPATATAPWRLALGTAAVAVVIVALAPAGGALGALRWAGTALAVGVALVLDEPTAELATATPTTLRRRRVRTLARTVPLLAAAWVALTWWAGTAAAAGAEAAPAVRACIRLIRIPLAVEFAAIVAVLLAVAAVVNRSVGPTAGGVSAATAVTLLFGSAHLLPQRWGLVVGPVDPDWVASHRRWAVVLAAGVALLWWASGDPWRRGRRAFTSPLATLAVLVVGAVAAAGLTRPTTLDARLDRLLVDAVAGQGLAAADAAVHVGDGGSWARAEGDTRALAGPAYLSVDVVLADRLLSASVPVSGTLPATDLADWAAVGLATVDAATELTDHVAAGLPPGVHALPPDASLPDGRAVEVVHVPATGRTVVAVTAAGDDTCGFSVAPGLFEVLPTT